MSLAELTVTSGSSPRSLGHSSSQSPASPLPSGSGSRNEEIFDAIEDGNLISEKDDDDSYEETMVVANPTNETTFHIRSQHNATSGRAAVAGLGELYLHTLVL